MPPLTCTHGNRLNSHRGVIDIILGEVFVVLARFLATDVVTLRCTRLSVIVEFFFAGRSRAEDAYPSPNSLVDR